MYFPLALAVYNRLFIVSLDFMAVNSGTPIGAPSVKYTHLGPHFCSNEGRVSLFDFVRPMFLIIFFHVTSQIDIAMEISLSLSLSVTCR